MTDRLPFWMAPVLILILLFTKTGATQPISPTQYCLNLCRAEYSGCLEGSNQQPGSFNPLCAQRLSQCRQQCPLGSSAGGSAVPDCRNARVATADLPIFCRDRCPSHPRCASLSGPIGTPQPPAADCRNARVATADLPIYCRDRCPSHPQCANLRGYDCRTAKVRISDLSVLCRQTCPSHPACRR